jgi:serine/threonine-protein kinase
LERGKDPLLGLVIDDRFRIDRLLGEGGMGTVYRGVQLSVNREVAIKLLRPELQNREIALERFFREARTISQLSHPNIVRLIDFGQDKQHDLLYLVMELINGFNLADLLSRGRVRLPLALDIVHQVCGALSEPHAAGVIHRDLKPDNILIVPMADGSVQAKVLDFGIARALEQNTQITATGMVCGTPAYMAPEQAQNEALDFRSDLYSLGVIMFEMISGWPPFSGTNSLQIMIKHIQEPPPTLQAFLPGGSVPPAVEALTTALLAKDRVRRPETTRFVRDRIEAIQQEMRLSRIKGQVGMSLDEAEKAWLLPKLPNADVQPSGPTEALRHDTDMERYLTRVDDERPTDVYDGRTRDEIYPTTPLQNHDAIRADVRVKVRTGTDSGDDGRTSPAAFAATELEVRTPEAVARVATAERLSPDVTLEGKRPEGVGGDRRLSQIAIGVGVLTLAAAAVVIWLAIGRSPEVVEPAPEAAPEAVKEVAVSPAPPDSAPMAVAAPVQAPVGPVVDLARVGLELARKDAAFAQREAAQKVAGQVVKGAARGSKPDSQGPTAAQITPPPAVEKAAEKPATVSEDDIFGKLRSAE